MSALTPIQRVMAAVELEEPDYVPVVPQITYTTARVINIKFSEVLYNSEKMAGALVAGYRAAGYDGIYVGWESSFNLVAEAMGCRLRTRQDGVPVVEGRVVKDPSDVDKVRIVDPGRDGRLSVHLRAIELVREEVGRNVPIFRYIPGPLTLASILRGQEKLLVELIKNPDLVHDLLKLSTESSKRFGIAAVEHGADVIVVADPMASTSVISPKMFDQFVFPYTRDLLKVVSQAGGVPSLHICGKTGSILKRMIETGTRIIELDHPVDLALAKEKIGKRVCIEGNLNPTGTLLTGKPEDVEREARECIEKAAEGGGFILSSGCEVPLDAPFKNVRAMVLSSKKYGRYPL